MSPPYTRNKNPRIAFLSVFTIAAFALLPIIMGRIDREHFYLVWLVLIGCVLSFAWLKRHE
jgi:hypothetical protein